MCSIAVIGAGLMGRLIALTLERQFAKQGGQITLIDKDQKSGQQSAAYAAAGLLTPLGEAMHCQQNIVEMGFASLKHWPEILDSLDQKVFFQQSGALMIAHEQDKGDYQKVYQYLTQHDSPSVSNTKVETLNREQLSKLEPELGQRFKQGLFITNEGQLDNRQLLLALQSQLEHSSVQWKSECQVISIDNNSNLQYTDVNLMITEQKFNWVIDCRGLGAKQTLCDAQDPSRLENLRGVRGELIHLYAPEVNIDRPIRLMHPRYQLYIAPKENHHYVIGATEIESECNSPTTVRSALELLTAAYSVHSGFAEAQIIQHVCQLRPAFTDNQPQIRLNKSLIQVNGLYRHGFLIAPVVLSQVSDLVNELINAEQDSHSSINTKFRYSALLPITHIGNEQEDQPHEN